MFRSAQMILDVFGKPVFVLPVDLPKEGCHIRVSDTSLDFAADSMDIGHIEGLDPILLALVSQQKTIGIIAWPENSPHPCPSCLTHTATVEVHFHG